MKHLKGTSQNIKTNATLNGGNKVIPQLEKHQMMAIAMSTLRQMLFFANGFVRHCESFMCCAYCASLVIVWHQLFILFPKQNHFSVRPVIHLVPDPNTCPQKHKNVSFPAFSKGSATSNDTAERVK